jgi:hypothetical protein
MGNHVRNDISKKNMYRLEKHRYLELRHFCLQYPQWKRQYLQIDGYFPVVNNEVKSMFSNDSLTEKAAEARIYLKNRIEMVENACKRASPEFYGYLLEAVTTDKSYVYLRQVRGIPCCKDIYYVLYRRFFWILDAARE